MVSTIDRIECIIKSKFSDLETSQVYICGGHEAYATIRPSHESSIMNETLLQGSSQPPRIDIARTSGKTQTPLVYSVFIAADKDFIHTPVQL